ncbi:MAG: cysteine desulfurase [Ignavibacteriales bacterium]|nr:cysteine desulfurase [Ignavibacteriales bacterium]
MRNVYLDHSATTPVDDRVSTSMQAVFTENFGNASSIHLFGREAKVLLEESRELIAKAIGARYDEVYFTSGGTEADNHALKGIAFASEKQKKNHIIISAIEHHAVLHSAAWLREHGFEVDIVPVDADALVDPSKIHAAIKTGTCLISVMHANNEVGTIEPIDEIAAIARSSAILFHSDTVQTVGKIPVDVNNTAIDVLSLSAHKMYGPKGIGAIYIRRGTKIDSLLQGGSQENNRRAGTENVPLAVGFAKAVEIAMEEREGLAVHYAKLREVMRSRLTDEFEAVILNGHPQLSLSHIVSVSFDSQKNRVDGDALIMGLDLRGVAVASGSACSSGSMQASHVLTAMGRDRETAKATIRFSMGKSTTEEDIHYAIDALHEVVGTMKHAVSS